MRVDPNNSNKVVAGTKTGLYFSYDAGNNWTGPCTTNNFSSQRQDITGLELSNVGGVTRILAAVGVRGIATTVQYNLNQNGANGIYKGDDAGERLPGRFHADHYQREWLDDRRDSDERDHRCSVQYANQRHRLRWPKHE